jgi:hypothetical protein
MIRDTNVGDLKVKNIYMKNTRKTFKSTLLRMLFFPGQKNPGNGISALDRVVTVPAITQGRCLLRRVMDTHSRRHRPCFVGTRNNVLYSYKKINNDMNEKKHIIVCLLKLVSCRFATTRRNAANASALENKIINNCYLRNSFQLKAHRPIQTYI